MRPIGLIRPMRLIGLISLMSCSSSDELQQPVDPEIAISFGGQMQDEQSITRSTTQKDGVHAITRSTTQKDGVHAITRSTSPLKDEVQTFTVWGFKNTEWDATNGYTAYQTVFNKYRVNWNDGSGTTTTNSSGWEYVGQQIPGSTTQTVKFWDYSAKAYRFMAVSGETVTGAYKAYEANEAHEAYGAYELTFTADADNESGTPFYSHLWFSTYSSNEFGSPVTLEFVKPLCKVRFMFIYEDPSKIAQLTNMHFRPSSGTTIKRKGDITVSYPLTGTASTPTETLTISANAGGISEFTKNYYTTPDDAGKEYWYTVLPAPNGQSAYSLTVSVDGDPKDAVVPAEFMTWLPGYKYTYIFKVHVDGSVTIDDVQSAFTPWTESTEERTVFNW